MTQKIRFNSCDIGFFHIQVKLRLKTHHENVEAVLAVYKDFIYKVNGNGPKEQVFAQIDKALSSLLEEKSRSDLESLASGTTH